MNRSEPPGITFNKARLAQYMERTGLTYRQTVDKLMKLYGHDCNSDRVNAEVDPIVDEQYRSHNRPPMHGK